jgi:hypothetical protein
MARIVKAGLVIREACDLRQFHFDHGPETCGKLGGR